MRHYYYSDGKGQSGPVTLEELKQKNIHLKTLIWFEGQDDWKEAREIPDLADWFKTLPPPLKASIPPPLAQKIVQTTVTKPAKGTTAKYIRIICGSVILLALIICVGVAYSSSSADNMNYDEQSTSFPDSSDSSEPTPSESAPRQKTEGELKEELVEKEAAHPKRYLTADFTYHVNLLSNTIIEGNISNSASVAGFKNVTLTVNFLSKTDVLLHEETFTVMEFISPGNAVHFKHKIQRWWENVKSVTYTIEGAEPY